MELSGLVILAMPELYWLRVFLLLNSTTGTTDLGTIPYGLVILTNALMAIPYAPKVLDNRCVTRLNAITRSVSLNISGFQPAETD